VRLTWRARSLYETAVSREGYAEAAQVYERVLALAPGSLDAKIGLAGALAASVQGLFGGVNDPEAMRRAEALIDDATMAVPHDASAHFQRGFVLRLQGRCDEAIREFEMAIDLDRNFPDAYSMLGQCKLTTGAIAEVIPIEEKAISLAPSSPSIGNSYHRIGMAELLQAHIDEAIRWYEKARRAQAMWHSDWVANADVGLAAAYALRGDGNRAAAALAEAQKEEEFPASVAALCRRYEICSTPKMRALAEATYLEGLRLAGLPEERAPKVAQ